MSPHRPFNAESPSFSRTRLFASARNAIWVAVVTMLIWVYADMEFIRTEPMSCTVRLNTNDPDRMVLVNERGEAMPAQEIEISFLARGSRSSLDVLSRRLKTSGPHILYDAARGREPDGYEVPAIEILRQDPDLEKLGVTIVSATPARVKFRLDRIIEKTVPVELQVEGGRLAQPAATRDVTVRAPAGLWAQIRERVGAAGPSLKTKPVDLREYSPGQRLNVPAVVVRSIAGLPVRIDNPEASFAIEIAAKPDADLETLPIKVNVLVLSPAKWEADGTWGKFTLERDDRTPWENVSVSVRGSSADIAKLKQKLDDVQAYLVLGDHDKKNMETPWERAVTLRIPPELKVELVGEPPKVWFRMLERTPS